MTDRLRAILCIPSALPPQPSAIVLCCTTRHVSAAVQLCRDSSLAVTVRGGGHNIGGCAVADGAVLIDLSKLNGVTLDGKRETCDVGGGALWSDVDAATTKHHLAVPAGLISHTGVGGLTLGGGVGWLTRMYGLTVDSLIEAEVVTADGNVVRASRTAHQDLFWGLRGGGAGLGVVTRFTFKLRSCTKVKMLDAHYMLPGAGAAGRQSELLHAYANLCSRAPHNVSIYCFVTATRVRFLAAEIITSIGDADAASSLPPPSGVFDAIQHLGPNSCRRYTQSLAQLNCQFDQGNRHGMHYRWSRSTFLRSFGKDVAATVVAAVQTPGGGGGGDNGVSVQITPLGGKLAAVTQTETAFHHRDAMFEVHGIATWGGSAGAASTTTEGVEKTAAIRRFSSAMERHGSAGYLNIHSPSTRSEEWLSNTYGPENLAKLGLIKGKYDPDNFFHSNPSSLRSDCSRGGGAMATAPAVWETVDAAADGHAIPPQPGAMMQHQTPHAVPSIKPPPPPPPPPPPTPPTAVSSVVQAVGNSIGRLQALLEAKLTSGLNATPPPLPRAEDGVVYWCDVCMQVIADDPPPFGTGNTRWHSSEGEFDMCNACRGSASADVHPCHMWAEVPLKCRTKFTADAKDRKRQLCTGEIILAVMHNFRNRWACGFRNPNGCSGAGHGDGSGAGGGGSGAGALPCSKCGLSLAAPSPRNIFVWSTYGEVNARVVAFSCGLKVHLGLRTRSTIGICAANSEDWLVADLSCIVANYTSIPLDPPASKAELQGIIQQSMIETIICSRGSVDTLLEIAAESSHLCRLIIIEDGGGGSGADDDACANGSADAVRSNRTETPPTPLRIGFAAVEAGGAALATADPTLFDEKVCSKMLPTDLATVIFSSGSTGAPKGAMLNEETFRRRVCVQYLLPDPCVVISYMPLAHSFDRVNVLSHFIGGGRIAFHTGPTATIGETLEAARPTSFSSTPRFWNTLYQEFQHLLQTGNDNAGGDGDAGASGAVGDNAKVLRRNAAKEAIKARLGGRVVSIGTGGAHTTPDVINFMRECFSCNVTDGFGATEAGGIAWDGTVGSAVKTKLLDVVEMGYTSNDQPFPRGELCVSNNALAGGYLNDEAATAAAFFVDAHGDRWYKTGDIVEVRDSGKIVLIDRRKALFKLAHGEFVAPQKVEQILETLPLIKSCWVTGRAAAEYPVAVVHVDERVAIKVLALLRDQRNASSTALHPSATIDGVDGGASQADMVGVDIRLEALCTPGSDLERAVMASIKRVDPGLIRSFERPRGIVIELQPWTVESGLVTGTLKLRRPRLETKYLAAIDELYKRLDGGARTTRRWANKATGDCTETTASDKSLALVDLAIRHLQLDDDAAVSFSTNTGTDDAASTSAVLLAASAMLERPLEDLLSDSLSAMEFMSAVNLEFSTKLSVSVLLEEGATLQLVLDHLTPATQQQQTHQQQQQSAPTRFATSVDFSQEARLADDITTFPDAGSRGGRSMQQVVLTGATGFVGAFLLNELLGQLPASCRVVCIVRADSDEAALNRVREALEQYKLSGVEADQGWMTRRWGDRVAAYAADLTQPNLGLSSHAFTRLGMETDLIVHCGARVHSLLPYSRLKAPNVLGTVELLRLASISDPSDVGGGGGSGGGGGGGNSGGNGRRGHRRGAFFCHVSTVGVLPPVVVAPLPEESELPSNHLQQANGYSQSKWVAEVMVRRAFDRGLRGCIIRPATVFAAECSGAANQTDFVIRSLRGMVQLGAVPILHGPRAQADLTPVDSLACAIVGLCSTEQNQHVVHGKVLNLTAPKRTTMTDLIEWLGEYVAHRSCVDARPAEPTAAPLQRLPFAEWQALLLTSDSPATPLHPLKSFFSGRSYPAALEVSRTDADAVLAKCGLKPLTEITHELVHQCFAALDAAGLLPGPRKDYNPP